MWKKNSNSRKSGNPDQAGNEWFDRTDDAQPFDAFGNDTRRSEIGAEIYARIWEDIHRRKRAAALYLRVAAAVIVLAISSLLVFKYVIHPNGSRAEWMVINSATNDYKKITLPDSSVIRLSAASGVRFPVDFIERSVYLDEGAALFDVRKDAARPFTVHVKSFTIKVLGTAFSVSAYKNQPDLRIEVVSGKIKVEQHLAAGKTKVLAEEMIKDQRLVVNLATTRYKIEQGETAKPATIQYGRQMTLQQIARELGEQFDLFVQLNNPDNDTSTYTVDIEGKSLNEILKELSAQTGFNYTVIQQHLIINPKAL